MKFLAIPAVFAVFAAPAVRPLPAGEAREEAKREPNVAHAVFFQLTDASPAAREKLIEACRKYLSKHDGQDSFAVGSRAEDLVRDVNDRDFDVFLYIEFKGKAAHDAYQKSPRHLQFIEENQGNWKKVRVFDSYLSSAKDAKEKDRVKEGEKGKEAEKAAVEADAYPDAAAGFAGMIRGKVAARKKNGIILAVEGIPEEWKHSKASGAKSLIGKKVTITAPGGDGEDAKAVGRFLKGLSPADAVTLDVANKKGDVLTVVELTEEQRKKASKGE